MASTGFQQSLSDPTIPAAAKQSSIGSTRAPAHASTAAQIAVGLSNFIGPVAELIKESGDDSLTRGMVERFTALQTARDQGTSAAEVDLRRNTYIDSLRSENPTKLDIINKVTQDFYGFNPRHVQAAAESKLTLQYETLGRQLLGEGAEYTREDYITKGAATTKAAKEMESEILANNLVTAGRQATAAEKEVKTSETVDIMTDFVVTSGKEALNSFLPDLTALSSNVGSSQEAKLVDDMMDRTVNTVNTWANTAIITVKDRLFSGAAVYANVDKASVLKGITDQVNEMKTNYLQSLSDAKKNGYLVDMGETLKTFVAKSQLTAWEAMPVVMGVTAALGPRIAQGFFQDLNVTRKLAPTVVKGLHKALDAFNNTPSATLEQRKGAFQLTLETKLALSSGKVTVLAMDTQPERQKALEYHARIYTDYRDDQNKGPRKSADGTERFPSKQLAVQSAQEDMVVTALDPTVTTAKSMREVTKFIDHNWVNSLDAFKDSHKSSLIAKGSQTLLVREFSHEQNNVRGYVVFNKLTGKYESNAAHIKLLDDDLQERMEEQGQPSGPSGPGGIPTLTQSKTSGKVFAKKQGGIIQDSIDNLNANLDKQWMFRNYSPAMTKATSQEQWAEAMHTTSALYGSMPYAEGQRATKDIEKVLQSPAGEVLKENQLVFERQAAKIAGKLSSAEKGVRTGAAFLDIEKVREEPFGEETDKKPVVIRYKRTKK